MATIIKENGLTATEKLAIAIDSFESLQTVKDSPVKVTGRYAHIEAEGDKGKYEKVVVEVFDTAGHTFFMDINGEVAIKDINRVMQAMQESGDELGDINIVIREIQSNENAGQSYNKVYIR